MHFCDKVPLFLEVVIMSLVICAITTIFFVIKLVILAIIGWIIGTAIANILANIWEWFFPNQF